MVFNASSSSTIVSMQPSLTKGIITTVGLISLPNPFIACTPSMSSLSHATAITADGCLVLTYLIANLPPGATQIPLYPYLNAASFKRLTEQFTSHLTHCNPSSSYVALHVL